MRVETVTKASLWADQRVFCPMSMRLVCAVVATEGGGSRFLFQYVGQAHGLQRFSSVLDRPQQYGKRAGRADRAWKFEGAKGREGWRVVQRHKISLRVLILPAEEVIPSLFPAAY